MNIKINTHGNPLPESHGEWIDLATAEEVELGYNDFKIISLGVSMELPKGYYAHVVPRSSTFKKWGIIQANSMGVIENDYCGDGDVWGFPAVCLRKEGVKIPKGTRICQFRLVQEAPTVEFEQVDKLGNADRGGYGSTGEATTRTAARASRMERMFGSRDTWNTPAAEVVKEKDPDAGQGPFRGFLMIKCDECGEVKAYCARHDTYGFRCKCGHETPLERLRPMYMKCKCGKEFRYKTNLQESRYTHTCMDCGSPVDMEINSRGTAFVTIGERR